MIINFDVATTGNITVQPGYGLDTNASGALKLGVVNATSIDIWGKAVTAITLDTDSTGNAEVLLPNDAIGPDEVLATGQSDGLCLVYESSGDTWAWASCGGSSYWSKSAEGILYPTLSEPIAATSSATTVATFTSASTNTALMAGSTGNYFTVSSNGDVTIPTSRTITIGGDSIDEFAGTGLTVSSGDLQMTLGTSISNGELDNDTIDFDKIASSLTLDEETTIAAGSALNLYIGNNVTLTTTGTGQITATDLSCTNCIGATERYSTSHKKALDNSEPFDFMRAWQGQNSF